MTILQGAIKQFRTGFLWFLFEKEQKPVSF